MTVKSNLRPILLLLGDVVLLYVALVLTLVIRYFSSFKSSNIEEHIVPFSILFVLWIAIFTGAGLYDKEAAFSRKRLFAILARAQVVNVALAAAFFYLVPFVSITPKANLFLYLIVSSTLLLIWRLYGSVFLRSGKMTEAVIIGKGKEADELTYAVNNNDRYGLKIAKDVDPDTLSGEDFGHKIRKILERTNATLVIIDMNHPIFKEAVPELYALFFNGVSVIDLGKVYEEIFDRVPLPLVRHNWFLENFSHSPRVVYDILKRVFDFVIAAVLLLVPVLVFPVVALAAALEGRSIFYVHERVGKGGRVIRVYKFQSLRVNHATAWPGEAGNVPTYAGRILRKTRLDEFPQLWNVLKGEFSLIGPRPDAVGIAERVRKQVPYYDARYLIKPGLSGWAQVKQELQPQSIPEMRVRLSYDLFYVKNRSFILDIVIALRTVKTLLSRTGR
ncbi:MAG: sugar transferase [Parcubacteria group bacterium]|nr:sugar transferase [Parcubacteria group bacterium]